MIYSKKLMLSAAVCALAASSATPALSADLKPYVGMDFSYLNADYTNNNDIALDDEFTGVNPYIGVQVHKNIGLEVGYLETGRTDKTFDGSGVFTGGGPGDTSDTKISGFHLDVMGSHNVTDKFEALGTVGIARFEADSELVVGGTPGVAEDTDTAWRIGAGGRYAVTENFGLRSLIRYNLVDFNDGTSTDTANGFWQANVGVQYRF